MGRSIEFFSLMVFVMVYAFEFALYAGTFLSFLVVVASFGADIAGFVIAGLDDCNLSLNDGKSQWFPFGVNEFLVIGGSVHFGVYFAFIVLIIMFLMKESWIDHFCKCINGTFFAFPVTIVSAFWIYMMLFLIPWNVIGSMLYSEMNESNQHCANVTISVVVIYFIESICMCVFPVMVMCFFC